MVIFIILHKKRRILHMIRQRKNTLFNALICMILFAALLLPTGLTTTKVQAAAKPSIDSKMEMGTGSIYAADYVYEKDAKYTLEVYNPVKKATYSFTSSKKDIVTVKTNGTKAYLTGVKAGTATITCQQKLNGKTTKVGTCKVTVKNATIYAESYDGLPMGTNESVLIYYGYRNCNATYTFTSNSKNFVMKEYSRKDPGSDGIYLVVQSYTAKKPGTYTVTVKETYNKKTRVVGKAEYEVKKATVSDEYPLYEEDVIGAYSLIYNSRADVDYFFEIGDDAIIELNENEDGGKLLKAKKAGTTTIKIYEDATKADESKLIGTCKITVEELKVESISVDFYDTETYVDGDNIEFSVYKEPYNAPDKITVTSSDPSIATVSEIDEEGCGEIIPVGEGTVTITITCGEFTQTETITVYADEDAMYEY
jgi:hypothetical protein